MLNILNQVEFFLLFILEFHIAIKRIDKGNQEQN